jgi:glycerol transport system substrate-binding protein
MKWFMDAAKKLQAKGVRKFRVVSETLTTHESTVKTLIRQLKSPGSRSNDLIQREGDVVEEAETSIRSGRSRFMTAGSPTQRSAHITVTAP